MRFFLPFLLLFTPFFSEGQARYFIYLKDKAGSSGRVDAPSVFLSQRAIDRRITQNISITERDLPVSKTYTAEIQNEDIDGQTTTMVRAANYATQVGIK